MKLVFQEVRLRLGTMDLELDLTLDNAFTALFGPSGAGKTSVLELVAGLRKPDRGRIELDGVTLADHGKSLFVPARDRAVGYIPQDLALFPHLTVRGNLDYGSRAAKLPGHLEVPREKLLRVLEIERLLDRAPLSLSGGEKQRVAFARALLSAPRLLLFDEPLASLDEDLKDRILPYLTRIRDEFSIPVIYVTHSASEVVALCEDVVVLQGGRCVRRGAPVEVFQAIETKVFRLRGTA